eukprot:CFRG4978T1
MSGVGKRLLIAIGGNSIVRNAKKTSIADQYKTIVSTANSVAKLVVKEGYSVAITHGNGPQVGFSMRRSEYAAPHGVPAVPLDVIDAQTEGQIGYQLTQALRNALISQGHPGARVVAVVNQVRVDKDDKAFETPSKPVGGFFSEEDAQIKMSEAGWIMSEQQGRGWRRIVASPKPIQVIEQWAIQNLMDAGGLVVCLGGGGVPVVQHEDGMLEGVPAVIDKDAASQLLAHECNFDAILFSTGVSNVCLDYNTPNEKPLRKLKVSEAQAYADLNQFPTGSMGPKIQAALQFLSSGGKTSKLL